MENKSEQNLIELILSGLGSHLDEINDSGLSVDRSFLEELGTALETEALSQGLPEELALSIHRAVVGPVASQLGL